MKKETRKRLLECLIINFNKKEIKEIACILDDPIVVTVLLQMTEREEHELQIFQTDLVREKSWSYYLDNL